MAQQETALITGVAGQDGIYLSRHLIAQGIRVVGTVQPGVLDGDPKRVYLGGVFIEEHDLRDDVGMSDLLLRHRPDQVYNLAAFSSVGASWQQTELVAEVNGHAVERLLDRVVEYRDRTSVDVRFFQASSAEEVGSAARSPYARAKSMARNAVARSREDRGLFACAAILHNHESPLRGLGFVTRKITRAAAEFSLGRREPLMLGNLEVSRDWGAARDYVGAMQLMLAGAVPQDLAIGTGVAHTLGQLLDTAFGAVGIDDPLAYVQQDPALLRPVDTTFLLADPGPALAAIGWRATIDFVSLVREMVDADLRRVRSGVEESPDYLHPPAQP